MPPVIKRRDVAKACDALAGAWRTVALVSRHPSHIGPIPFAEINMIALLTLALGYTDRGILKLDNT